MKNWRHNMSEKHLDSTITVKNDTQFQNAIASEYGKIILSGENKDFILKNFNKMKTGNTASNVAIVLGLFFWPSLIGGIVGKLFLRNAMKYEVKEITSDYIVFIHKDCAV